MDVRYLRTMEQSFVYFQALSSEGGYEEKMLQNKIEGVLPFRTENENGIVSYAFDITNKLSLSEYTKIHELDESMIGELLRSIIDTILGAKNYLLVADNFIIDMRYIYLGDNGRTFWLCYYIGYGHPVKEQLKVMFEEWMKIIDYDNSATVRLVYELYRLSKLSTCTYDQLLHILLPKEEMVKERESDGRDSDSVVSKESETFRRDTEQIVAMVEELEDEKEILYYPIQYYIKMAFCITLGVASLLLLCKTPLLKNPSHQFDLIRFACVFVVIIAVEIVVFQKLFQKDHKESKMVAQKELISIHENEPMKQHQMHATVTQKENSTYDKYGIAEERDVCTEESTQILLQDELTMVLKNNEILTLKPQTCGEKEIIIDTREVSIGSSKKYAQIILPFSTISREHSRIIYENGIYYVEDKHSTNGTFLNGVRLTGNERRILMSKDILKFAEYSYEVFIGNLSCEYA